MKSRLCSISWKELGQLLAKTTILSHLAKWRIVSRVYFHWIPCGLPSLVPPSMALTERQSCYCKQAAILCTAGQTISFHQSKICKLIYNIISWSKYNFNCNNQVTNLFLTSLLLWHGHIIAKTIWTYFLLVKKYSTLCTKD